MSLELLMVTEGFKLKLYNLSLMNCAVRYDYKCGEIWQTSVMVI